jgi:hypothetical protein
MLVFRVETPLKMEAVRSSETLVSADKSALRYSPQDHRRHFHRRENLIS